MTCKAHSMCPGFLLSEDVDHIQSIATLLFSVPNVIDLGAGYGTTALSVFAVRPEACITSVDISASQLAGAEGYVGNSYCWHPVEGDSVAVAEKLPNNYFDMMLLDTTHLEDDTIRELETWLPKLIARGFVWCHDYVDYPGTNYPGVMNALTKFEDQLEMISMMGLGWAGRKGQ